MFGKKKSEPTAGPMKAVDIQFQLSTDSALAPDHEVRVTMKSEETHDMTRLTEKAAYAHNRDPREVKVTKWRIL